MFQNKFIVRPLRERLLFGAMLLVCKGFVWLTKLKFYLLSIAHLPNPLENDLVVYTKSTLDYEDVIHLVLDDDLALVHHVIFADDENVPLVKNLKRRPLRDDDGVLICLVDQHVAGLTVTQ